TPPSPSPTKTCFTTTRKRTPGQEDITAQPTPASPSFAHHHREDSMHHLSSPTPIIATGPPLARDHHQALAASSSPITIATHARKERAEHVKHHQPACRKHHRSPPQKEESTTHLSLAWITTKARGDRRRDGS
ncbi:hypothetical protein Dimus_012812, partial [Dionaea muscipula]